MAGNNWRRGVYGGLFTLFALVALWLAGLGLFAVVASGVAQRTQEIGLRLAIGATPRDVVTMVLWQGLAPAAIGLAVGLAASAATNTLLAAQLVEVAPSDPATTAGRERHPGRRSTARLRDAGPSGDARRSAHRPATRLGTRAAWRTAMATSRQLRLP